MAGNDPFNANDPMARTVIVPSPSNRKSGQSKNAAQHVERRSAPRNAGLNLPVPKSGESFDPSAYPNPLIRAAGPILMSATQLKDTLTNADPSAVRTRMSSEMRAFDKNAKNFGVSIPQTNAARYILCTFIDEIVMSTPWGAQSGWSKRSLLSEFYGETSGGAKVFTVIDRAQNEPGSYNLLLELSYMVLALGFEGQYRIRNGGELKKIQDNLFHSIRMQKAAEEKTLSPNWRGEEQNRSDRFIKIVPLWIIALGGLTLMGFLYGSYALALNEVREPIYRITQQIAADGEDLLAATPAPLIEPFDLEARLVPYVGNGLSVDIENGVAMITLQGGEGDIPLFRSGGVQLHRRVEPILDRIAEVLKEVPGDVTITGHTDGQGRVLSNQRLSERRANTVRGELIFKGLERDRFETRGFGSNQPLIPNEESESDRAMNRRVTIRFRVPDGMEAQP